MGIEGSNGEGPKPVRVITEPGAFGKPAHMIIVRRFRSKAEKAKGKKGRLEVESFIVMGATKEMRLEQIEAFKKKHIPDPLFVSFTVLKFVEETRPLEEAEPSKIVMPSPSDTRRFGRSKYMPGE